MSQRQTMLLGVLAAAWLAATPARAGGPLESLPDAVARVRRAVGAVGVYNPAAKPPLTYSASGFFVRADGYFLTADHVLEGIAEHRRLEDLRVYVAGLTERTGRKAAVVAREAKYDMALLKVQGEGYPTLELGRSEEVREGQAVALCGYPLATSLGLHPSTSAGIISSIVPRADPAVNTRFLDSATIQALRDNYVIFQLDVTAYPGHSGGPLFDPRTGRVLGMVDSAFIKKTKEKVFASGISYAIPIRFARQLLERALEKQAGGEEAP
ncbi:MAG: S1C family serine protease [Candidatus Brocadiia bacterium]